MNRTSLAITLLACTAAGALAQTQIQTQAQTQPAATKPPDAAADLALFADAQKQSGSETVHRVGDVVVQDDLRFTLVSFGYAPKPREWSSPRPDDEGSKFDDLALHFIARVRIENASGGRYAPVDSLTRFASRAEVARYAKDNWDNVISDDPGFFNATPALGTSIFSGMTDASEYKPGGPLMSGGVLPPGSTCELEVELDPPLFIATSKYFLYYHPGNISAAGNDRLCFFIPVSEVRMPKEGEYIWGTPEFYKQRDQLSSTPAAPNLRRTFTGAEPLSPLTAKQREDLLKFAEQHQNAQRELARTELERAKSSSPK